MTINAASTRDVVTLPNGATNTTFGFDYLDVAYINVYYDGVLKVQGLDYTISSQTVTFTPALTQETVVAIISNEPYGNPYDLIEPEQWTADAVNQKVDMLALQVKQVRDGSVQVGPFDPVIDINTLLAELEAAVEAAVEAATLAQAWAESPTAVTPGHFSAKYWADVSQSMVIPPDSITTAMLQNGCVTTPKLAGAAVTIEKIAAGIFIPIEDNGYRGHAIGTGLAPNEFMILVSGLIELSDGGGPNYEKTILLSDLGINITGIVDSEIKGAVAIRNTVADHTEGSGGVLSLIDSPPRIQINYYATGLSTFPFAGFTAMFKAIITP